MGTKPERRGVYKCPRRHIKRGTWGSVKERHEFYSIVKSPKGEGETKTQEEGCRSPKGIKGVWMG